MATNHHKLNMICIPYAGGSATVYARWRKRLDESIKLIPIELRGRGARINEPFYEDLHEAVEDVYQLIHEFIQDESPYILFGHSMGCAIVYELSHRIMQEGGSAPVHLFLSGRSAPQVKRENKERHKWADQTLIEDILKLGGTRKEIFENPELCSLFLPIIRADYKIIETYNYSERQPADVAITVLTGSDDETIIGDVSDWKYCTSNSFDLATFQGGHFFIHECEDEVIQTINSKIVDINRARMFN